MKLLLVNPLLDFDGIFARNTINLGLLYLGAIAQDLGHQVKLSTINKYDIKGSLKRYDPDLVGISCMDAQYQAAKRITEDIKDYDQTVKVAWGGYFPTFHTETVLEETEADYVFVGEAEATWRRFLNQRQEGSFDGRRVIKSEGRVDLANLPNIYERDLYPLPAGILTSRGCPGRCSFCSIRNFYRNQTQEKEISRVIEEIKALRDRGHKLIRIRDDDFFFDGSRVKKLAKSIIEEDLDLIFSCQARIKELLENKDLLGLLERAGFRMISVGVQNFQQSVLDKYNVNFSSETARKLLKFYEEYEGNISLRMYYIVDCSDTENIEFTRNYIENVFEGNSYPNLMICLLSLTPLSGSDVAAIPYVANLSPDVRHPLHKFEREEEREEIFTEWVKLKTTLKQKDLLHLNFDPNYPFWLRLLRKSLNIATSSFPLSVKKEILQELFRTYLGKPSRSFLASSEIFRIKEERFF